MGEIFHALEVLNRSMKLGLSGQDLMRAEMGFKSALAMQSNPNPTVTALAANPAALAEQYELKATLQRRSTQMSLNQLSALASKAVRTPRTRVRAATFRKIDTAMAAASRVSSASSRVGSTGALAGTRLTTARIGVAKRAKKKSKRK